MAALPITNRVRELREAAGVSQSDLGLRIGMTRQTVAAIEQGRYSPSLESAFRIAQALGVELEDAFQWRG
jgi:putative transcriptional regulator